MRSGGSNTGKGGRVSGLRYVSDAMPGIRRRRAGKGFSYIRSNDRRVRNHSELERIARLAVPPAWTDVWICPHPNGHILATGRDARARKQYRYHPRWRVARDAAKFDKTIAFGTMLPKLRRRVTKDLSLPGLPKEKVVAAVVRLLDTTLVRVGNDEYARDNDSFGLTTLRAKHVRVQGPTLRLRFKGKGGKLHAVDVDDARVVSVVRRCREIPGQELFQYLDDDNGGTSIGSADVNDYLREVGGEDFSAKDFRTWAGTVLAASELVRMKLPVRRRTGERNILKAVDAVAAELRNTRTICRNCYVHPDVIEGYLDGSLFNAWKRASSNGAIRGLRRDEAFVLNFLRGRERGRRSKLRAA